MRARATVTYNVHVDEDTGDVVAFPPSYYDGEIVGAVRHFGETFIVLALLDTGQLREFPIEKVQVIR
jgi:hypothetical protein